MLIWKDLEDRLLTEKTQVGITYYRQPPPYVNKKEDMTVDRYFSLYLKVIKASGQLSEKERTPVQI